MTNDSRHELTRLANAATGYPGAVAAAVMCRAIALGVPTSEARSVLARSVRADVRHFASNPAALAPVISRARQYVALGSGSRARRRVARRLVGHVVTPAQGTRRATLTPAKLIKMRFAAAVVGGRILAGTRGYDSVLLTPADLGHAMGSTTTSRSVGRRQLDAAVSAGALVERQRRVGGGVVLTLNRLDQTQGLAALDRWEDVEALAADPADDLPSELTLPSTLAVLLRSASTSSLWGFAPDGYWGHGVSGIEAWTALVALSIGLDPTALGVPARKVRSLMPRLEELHLAGALVADPLDYLARLESLAADVSDHAASQAQAAREVAREQRLESLAAVRAEKTLEHDADIARRKEMAKRKRAAAKASKNTDIVFLLRPPPGFLPANPAHLDAAIAAAVRDRGGRWEVVRADAKFVRLVRVDDLDPTIETVTLPPGFVRAKHGAALLAKVESARGGTWKITSASEGTATLTKLSNTPRSAGDTARAG